MRMLVKLDGLFFLPMPRLYDMADCVYKQLRRSFKVVGEQRAVWLEASESCGRLLGSLASHAEQLQCCRRAFADDGWADGGALPAVAGLPGLQARLEFKLTRSMEILLAKLQPHMQAMEEVCRRHTQLGRSSLAVYRGRCRELDVAVALARTATRPSLADMLQWLLDIDGLYRRLYAERKWLVETVSYDNLEELQALASRWPASDRELGDVQSILAHVTFFLADG